MKLSLQVIEKRYYGRDINQVGVQHSGEPSTALPPSKTQSISHTSHIIAHANLTILNSLRMDKNETDKLLFYSRL